MKPVARFTFIAVVALAIAAGAVGWFQSGRTTSVAGGTPLASSPVGRVGEGSARRTYSLIDQHGQSFTDERFRGTWLVVFFGFTHCPDFCPTTLYRLARALDQLGGHARDIRVLFITVDPERDTPQVLEQYIGSFAPTFTAATGSAEQIAAATHAFRTYSRKQPAATDGSYTVDHSTLLYVVAPDGLLDRQLSSDATAEQLAATLRTIVDSRSERDTG